jgi:hypothetical protein
MHPREPWLTFYSEQGGRKKTVATFRAEEVVSAESA